ncbi:MAG: HAMP domain-containing sensor histidine kinase, partial [Desulfohalobium sp.]
LSLDLYKMEQGTYTLHPQSVDLARIVRRIFLQLKNEARVKQLPTAVYGHGHLLGKGDQFWVRGDPLLCYSLFSNLIKNALEASPEGEEVSVHMEIQESRALIKVHNSGAVPREVREVFFDKLSTYGKNTGTGLGTYSAALMAKTMQGDIDMQTSEEKGTFVLVWLPVESAPQEDTPMGVELL